MLAGRCKRGYLKEKHHSTRSGTLDIDIDHAGLHARFTYDGLHLPGDVVEAVVGGVNIWMVFCILLRFLI